jgi:Xaa-Pro aminopeptidase
MDTTKTETRRIGPAPGLVRITTICLVALLTPILAAATSPSTAGDVRILDARARWETLNQIRQDKFDLILPGAMRDNGVDMWIHVIRWGDPDPLELDLGGEFGTFVFTDRGGNRIERAVLGGAGRGIELLDVYDIFGDPSDLREMVEERDPKVIAINSSAWLAVADGISHTEYQRIVDELGPKYAARLVSADKLISDFRVRRVSGEIAAFSTAGEMTRRIMERALSSEVITPGVTTLIDVAWWVQDRLLEMGVRSSFGISTPYVLYSATATGNAHYHHDYVIQRGDFLAYDMGIRYLNFGTDFKRHAYVMREGEAEVPDFLQQAFERGLKAREIMRLNIKVGRTAGDTLALLADKLEAEGFVYTPFTDIGSKDRAIVAAMGDDPRTGISIDCHTVGNTGNSEVAVGPSFAPFRPDRAHVVIQPGNLFAFEFIIHHAIPDGTRVRINLEDNAIVTAYGVEWLYPPNSRILEIR